MFKPKVHKIASDASALEENGSDHERAHVSTGCSIHQEGHDAPTREDDHHQGSGRYVDLGDVSRRGVVVVPHSSEQPSRAAEQQEVVTAVGQ